MLMTVPTVSVVLAAGLALLNLWLGIRVGQVRTSEKVSVGDGGNERVIRRMRAHANFAENGWVVMALVLVIELSVGSSLWLWLATGLFLIGRVLHGFGMDGWRAGRGGGTLITFAVQMVLVGWALTIPVMHGSGKADDAIEIVPARG